MRRSAQIVTPLLAAAALSILTGCRPKEMQRCVDEHDNVVDDKFCANGNAGQPQGRVEQRPNGYGGFIPFFIPMYRSYYGGAGGYGLGNHVYGGGYTAVPGRSYSSPSRSGFFGITRGGFGSSLGGGHGSSGE